MISPLNAVLICPKGKRKEVWHKLIETGYNFLTLDANDFSPELIKLGFYSLAVVQAINSYFAEQKQIETWQQLNDKLIDHSLVIVLDLDELYTTFGSKDLVNAIMDMPNGPLKDLKHRHIGLLVFISNEVGGTCKSHNYGQFKSLWKDYIA